MPNNERGVTQLLEFTPQDVEVVHDALSGLEFLETCDAITGGKIFDIPYHTIPSTEKRSSNGLTREEYAEAALLCLKDGEQKTVEEYFVRTRLVGTADIYRALGEVLVIGSREETIFARAAVTIAGNKAVLTSKK